MHKDQWSFCLNFTILSAPLNFIDRLNSMSIQKIQTKVKLYLPKIVRNQFYLRSLSYYCFKVYYETK